jgi:hypothetical protein
MTYAAQVSLAFFTNGSDKKNRTFGLNLRRPQRLNYRDERNESAAVVGDAGREQTIALAPHGEVGSFGKDRVEMSADNDQRSGGSSAKESETVAFFVDRDLAQTKLAKFFREILGALLFGERSCGHRADANLFVSDRGGVGLEKTQRLFDLWQDRKLANGPWCSSFE